MNGDKEKNSSGIIKLKYQILCEGIDAKNFLIKYLNSDAFKDVPFASNDIEVRDFGGNERLKDYLKMLKAIKGYSNVVSLLIIRDAEKDMQKAVSQIQSALSIINDTHVPEELGKWSEGVPKTCFLLFPDFVTKDRCGTLEDLCSAILNNEKVETPLEEIDAFIEHLKPIREKPFRYPHKTRLHTYFSVNSDFVSMKLGEAAKAGAFDWFHPKLEPLKNCIKEMVQGQGLEQKVH